MAARETEVVRETRETRVEVRLRLDGSGDTKATIPDEFLRHMVETLSRYSGADLDISARGDLAHHLIEDVAITLGRAYRQAMGEGAVKRIASATVPMDEALVSATVDVSGRPYLVFAVPVARQRVSSLDLDLLQEFFRALAFNAEITLHVTMHYGHNLHHITEAVFKAVGRALAAATRIDARIAGLLPSTKGRLG